MVIVFKSKCGSSLALIQTVPSVNSMSHRFWALRSPKRLWLPIVRLKENMFKVYIKEWWQKVIGGMLWNYLKFTTLESIFRFSLRRTENGQPEAIIWCIAEMRTHQIRYPSFLFIDMRKTARNTTGWNYFRLTVQDCDAKVRFVAECLSCAETNDMWAWGTTTDKNLSVDINFLSHESSLLTI